MELFYLIETLGVGSSIQSAMCDVVWDKAFVGASSLDGLCPERRGYRIPQYSLLKLAKYAKKKEEREKNSRVNSEQSVNQRQVLQNDRNSHSPRSP